MVKYAVNTQKGSTINHPILKLVGGIAYPITDEEAIKLKHIMNVVIFDEIGER